jgi:hypothetical protein
MRRPADTIESNISFSFSIASTSTKHLGSKSKPSMSSLATSSWWHSALRLSMVIPSPGTTIAQSGLFSLTSNDTCEREMFVSKLVAPSSIMKGQLFAVRWIDSMYLKSGWSPRKGWQLKRCPRMREGHDQGSQRWILEIRSWQAVPCILRGGVESCVLVRV